VKHIVFAHRKLSFGGGERVLMEQVAALAGLPIKISVLFRKEPGKRDIEKELRERNPQVTEVLHVPGTLGVFRWLWRTRPDLVVLCNHKGAQRALPWLARLGLRMPLVVTLHEHYARHLRHYTGIKHLVDRWLCTYNFTATVREQLSQAPCSIIHPLYPRPETMAATPADRQAARKHLGLPETGLVVGYVGQMDLRKDPLSVVRLAEALGPVHLLFAGREETATTAALDAYLAHSPLRDRTVRLGPQQDLGTAFSALDLYVLTSRNEGFFPLALIEAMERGVPVLAPTVGGIGTVLQDGEGGFLIQKPDDRRSIPEALLKAAAERLGPLLADTPGWEAQRHQAHAFATALTRDYDAAQKFREALAPWL